jgi:hypothetical protein
MGADRRDERAGGRLGRVDDRHHELRKAAASALQSPKAKSTKRTYRHGEQEEAGDERRHRDEK